MEDDGLSIKDNVIYEIHYFKPHGKSFVNFYNLSKHGQDVSAARNDVITTFHEEKASEHFWLCRLFPGIRSTYPVKDNNGKTIGVVSVGLHLINYSVLFSEAFQTKNILIYNDAILKQRLLPVKYDTFLKGKIENDGWVYDSQFARKYESIIGSVDFKSEHQRYDINGEEHVVVCIPLRDKNKIVNAYMLLIKPMGYIKNSSLRQLLTIIVIVEALLVILATYVFIKKDVLRIYKLIDLLKNIGCNDFSRLDSFIISKDRDELSVLEQHTIEMAQKLSIQFDNFANSVEKFKFHAEHDTLTGLLNRRTLEENQVSIFEGVEYHSLSVMMLDIDYFKKINDTYGHDHGDIVLKEVANAIESVVRKDDLVFRYGGEEFCIILKNTPPRQAVIVSEKLRRTIENLDIYVKYNDRDLKISLTISGGLSVYTEEYKTIYDLIRTADKLLYKAKEAGRNQVMRAMDSVSSGFRNLN